MTDEPGQHADARRGPRRSRATVARFGLLAGLAVGLAAPAPAPPPAAGAVSFEIEETLMLPTRHGVSLVMKPRVDTTLFVEYGTGNGRFEHSTPVQTVSALHTAKFTIDDLRAGQAYGYRVQCKPAGGHAEFVARPEHAFRTLPAPGESFAFAYTTDSHAYAQWTQDAFSAGGDFSYQMLQVGLGNLALDDLHFFIIGGDWVMTDCPNCKGGTVDGSYYPDSVIPDAATARQRYAKIFSPQIYGSLTKSLPFVYVLGNHDGEEGFSEGIDTCESYTPLVKEWSESARRDLFADSFPTYGGDRHGRYYSFEAGDALICVIDIMGHQTPLPVIAEDWSLDADQWAWLANTVSGSARKWKFVFAEHLVGGEAGPTSEGACYYYGRGSIKATGNNKTTGNLKGGSYGQGAIQELLAANITAGGAAFFCSGHDHVAIGPNEKPAADGTGTRVFYTTGGTLGAGAPWTTDAAFQKEMDIDGDNKPDYNSDVDGSTKRGYFRITVDGPDSVTFEYVQSSPDAGANGTTVYSEVIHSQ